VGPLRRAEFIRLLAERARSPEEIREMLCPLGMLWIVHRPQPEWLVEHFDCLLRRWDRPAADAMSLADTLTVAAQRSAATFEQIVEAMVEASSASPVAA
jgi:hypothetical protein